MQGLPEIGDILDDTYVIESMLGQGGFGAVYLGRQMSMDRKVAIKVLVAHAMRVDEMIERFRREVMAVRNLSHPNTIRIYDFHENGDEGFLYYVMEYIKGPTLKEIIKKGPMPPKRVAHIVRQILKSLSEAHAQNIVHRDLKPANIMLADLYGETDFVKVVDFGIAKIVGESEENDEDPLTSAGVLVGTLRYMSPEQITGQGIGPRSDIYALALMAVEMLTGESVFAGTGRWEVLHKQISDDPVEIDPAVAATPLGEILEKALSKDPGARFQTAEEMAEAIESLDEAGQEAKQPMLSETPISDTQDSAPQDSATPDSAPQDSATPDSAPTTAGEAPSTQSVSVPTSDIPPATQGPDEDATIMAELPQSEAQPPEDTGVVARSEFGFQSSNFVDTTGSFETEAGDQKSKKTFLFIGLTVALLATFVGVYVFTTSQSSEETPPAPDASTVEESEIAAADPAKERSDERAAQPIDEPASVEDPQEAARAVQIVTESVVAEAYEDGTLLGSTPLAVEIEDTPRRITLRSEGYQDHELELTSDSEDIVAPTLQEIEKVVPVDAPPAQRDDAVEAPPRKTETVRRTSDDKEDPASEPPAKDTDDPGSGWVDLAPSKETKDPPEKDSDVPLFE